MVGLIGKKIGMTSIFLEDGKNLACTIVEAGPCYISQIKTKENDGYDAVQIAFGEKKVKRVNKPQEQHFKKAGITAKKKLVELRYFGEGVGLGDKIDVSIFNENEFVDVIGTSKGKGFQGVVKRHGFSGVGMRTHGQHDRERAPGSIGASSYPSRVFKGMRMAGQTGNKRVKVLNLQVVKILKEQNILLIRGAVPGAINSYLIIEK